MIGIKTSLGVIAAFFSVGYSVPASAAATSASVQISLDVTDFSAQRGGGARRAGGGGRNVNVNRNINRNVNANRNLNVNRAAGRNVNVSVNRRVVVRPVRPWVARPYFGTVVGGIALGTIIAASAAGAAPVAPAPNMCWFWVDSAQVQGYWDYCRPPY